VVRKFVLMLFAAAAAHLTASHSALAADLAPGGRPLPSAYIPPPPIPYLWTGCYVGGNIGGAWSNVDLTDVSSVKFSTSNSGFAGGGQVGCDYQARAWVVGLRDMFDATSLNGSTAFSTKALSGTFDSRTNWFDTLTARAGYLVQPNVLLYAQGGAAWANTDITVFNGASAQIGEFSSNHTGWTVGAGAEWMFAQRWSVFAEYNFMDFGTQTAAFGGCGGTCTLNAKEDVQSVLAGVNYKF
jgi:outer membrane immunogenic protein